ncbi:hypothetical protein C8F04DRAFT_1346049 [Mycena alexandri]|uniref:Uncharacterized protein n=1 Tax=Mycena alexandri TaxID=1745969 RepID=A0AAD6RWX4_9AGAR|nr:hypothetical protein C8F04DRAFT_1346049 [Mycena alexandri]
MREAVELASKPASGDCSLSSRFSAVTRDITRWRLRITAVTTTTSASFLPVGHQPLSACLWRLRRFETASVLEILGDTRERFCDFRAVGSAAIAFSACCETTSTLLQSDVEDVMDEDEADDYYYASHARTYITLSPPLPPPSFPRRESALIPTIPAPRRPRLSTPPPSRPPPRTPVPTDAVQLSDDFDYAADYAAYAPLLVSPLLVSRTPSPESASSAARLAALLSPPPHTPAAHSSSSSTPHTPATPAPHHPLAVPRDIGVDADEWDSEDDEFVYGAAYDEDAIFDEYAEDREEYNDLYLDLAVVDDVEMEPEEEVAVSDVPTPAPYTGWHPRPRASQLRLVLLPILTVTSHSPTPSLSSPSAPSSAPFASAQEREPEQATPEPQTPALRSRWSSSTLSSVPSIRSPHAAASPKTFGFARRYFPRVKASTSPSPSTSASSSRVGANKREAQAHGRRVRLPFYTLTEALARAAEGNRRQERTHSRQRPARPPSLSMSNAMRDHAAYTPYMAKAGDDTWIGTRPSTPSVLACTSPDVFASYSGSASSPYSLSPSSSGQRGSKHWSYASAPGDGGEEADDDAGSMRGGRMGMCVDGGYGFSC